MFFFYYCCTNLVVWGKSLYPVPPSNGNRPKHNMLIFSAFETISKPISAFFQLDSGKFTRRQTNYKL